MLNMIRQYVGHDSLIRHTSLSPIQPTGPLLELYALHPLLAAVAGGRKGEVDVLIGNKCCAFLPFSLLPMFFERTALGDWGNVLTLKVDIFVFVYGWKHPRPSG